MHESYTLEFDHDERVGGLWTARLYRIVAPAPAELVAEVDKTHGALGIGDVFEAFADQLIVDREYGELS